MRIVSVQLLTDRQPMNGVAGGVKRARTLFINKEWASSITEAVSKKRRAFPRHKSSFALNPVSLVVYYSGLFKTFAELEVRRWSYL